MKCTNCHRESDNLTITINDTTGERSEIIT